MRQRMECIGLHVGHDVTQIRGGFSDIKQPFAGTSADHQNTRTISCSTASATRGLRACRSPRSTGRPNASARSRCRPLSVSRGRLRFRCKIDQQVNVTVRAGVASGTDPNTQRAATPLPRKYALRSRRSRSTSASCGGRGSILRTKCSIKRRPSPAASPRARQQSPSRGYALRREL